MSDWDLLDFADRYEDSAARHERLDDMEARERDRLDQLHERGAGSIELRVEQAMQCRGLTREEALLWVARQDEKRRAAADGRDRAPRAGAPNRGGRMSVLDSKCAKPQNPKPGITTFFCVYDKGHGGTCSWADPPDVRRAKLLGDKA